MNYLIFTGGSRKAILGSEQSKYMERKERH